MFCKNCGKEIDDKASICLNCGVAVPKNFISGSSLNGNPKTLLGVVLCLTLGLLGLIIGLCMYPSGSVERETFVRGWVSMFVSLFAILVILSVYIFAPVLDSIFNLL